MWSILNWFMREFDDSVYTLHCKFNKIGLNYESINLSREPRRKNLWKKNKEQMAWRVLLSKQLLFLAPCQHCLEDWRLRLKYESDDILMDFLLNFLPNHNWIFHFIRLAHINCFPCYFLWDHYWLFNWICLLSPNSLLYFCEQVQAVKLYLINFVTVTLNLFSQEVLTGA